MTEVAGRVATTRSGRARPGRFAPLLLCLLVPACGTDAPGGGEPPPGCLASTTRDGVFVSATDRSVTLRSIVPENIYERIRMRSDSPVTIVFDEAGDASGPRVSHGIFRPVPNEELRVVNVHLTSASGLIEARRVAASAPLPSGAGIYEYQVEMPRGWTPPPGFGVQIHSSRSFLSQGTFPAVNLGRLRDQGFAMRDGMASNLRRGLTCEGRGR